METKLPTEQGERRKENKRKKMVVQAKGGGRPSHWRGRALTLESQSQPQQHTLGRQGRLLCDESALPHSLSTIALYALLSLIRRLPSCADTSIPTTSAISCATQRSNRTDTATLMMATHSSVNRADNGNGINSSTAETNLVGASKTETLSSESATRENISHPN
jgi:hypothetical protein